MQNALRGAFGNTLTFIKLPFVIKTFVLSIFELQFYTGVTSVQLFRHLSMAFDASFLNSCINTYVHSCLKLLSNEQKSMFKLNMFTFCLNLGFNLTMLKMGLSCYKGMHCGCCIFSCKINMPCSDIVIRGSSNKEWDFFYSAVSSC